MRNMVLGMVAGALLLSVLSGVAMAQSAYERYPDPYASQRYPDQNVPRPSYPAPNNYGQTYPDTQGRYRMPATTDQAYRDGYRAGWWAGRRGQTYDDRRPDYRSRQDYRR
jgi:hypothetical protein